MSRAQELVDAHFDGYVGPLLTAAGVEDKITALCAFMYKSSGIHFYKHAQEDAVEAARGAFANYAAHKAPSLCDSEDARDTAAAYPYTFPAALKYMGMLSSDYVVKLREEVGEVSDATNPTDRVIELLDVIHVAETGIRSHALDHGLDVKELVGEVIRKNSERGYYNR